MQNIFTVRTSSPMAAQQQLESSIGKWNKSSIIDRYILGISSVIYDLVYDRISVWIQGSYYPAKDAVLINLRTDIDRVCDAALYTLINHGAGETEIQGLAYTLGMKLGYSDLEAITVGAWILGALNGVILTLSKGKDKQGNDYGVKVKIPNLVLDTSVQEQIDMLQYLPPMMCRPLPWTSNKDGGYFGHSQSIFLGKWQGHHDDPVDYTPLNILQDIPLCLDDYTLDNYQDTSSVQYPVRRDIQEKYRGEYFYFVWQYDTRLRMYSSGYQINFQGNEYNKSLISLYNKHPVKDLDTLKIAIANHAGKDKLTWDNRIAWFNNINDWANIKWKEPMLGMKAATAYINASAGKPTGYLMNVDACSSGIQIMSTLIGCKVSGANCGLINTGERADIYGKLISIINSQLPEEEHITDRDTVKYSLMPWTYNSIAAPKRLLTEAQLPLFYTALGTLIPGVIEVMKLINRCWNPEADQIKYQMPNGSTVYVPLLKKEKHRIEMGEFNGTRFTWYRYVQGINNNKWRSLAPHIVQSIDAMICAEMVKRANVMGFELLPIHDSFWFTPDRLWDVNQMYREILAEIADSDLLQFILNQLAQGVTVEKFDTDMSDSILQSEYALS